MKLIKTDKAWSYSDYMDESKRFLFKNVHSIVKDGRTYSLPASKCGWELYDNGQKVGFFNTLKAAKVEAEGRI